MAKCNERLPSAHNEFIDPPAKARDIEKILGRKE